MPLHSPARRAGVEALLAAAEPGPTSIVGSVESLQGHLTKDGSVESPRLARAWALYETPEVRFACRQYSNAFSSAKLQIGRRPKPWRDPVPITDPKTPSEVKALELLESFAGGPVGQAELLDRMGTYFMVTGDMALVGAYDPGHIADNKFARWDVWSTTEIRWTGRTIRIREHAVEDIWQEMPEYIKHLRVWNRHPRRGWESDSPVLSAMNVLELAGLYDDRLAAEALSRLIGAGVWMIPQGMKLPTSTGEAGGPEDFLKLLRMVAELAIKDRRSAAANVPIMIEAAADDIEAASKGRMTFHTEFAASIGDLQEAAFRRWATGVDIPAEVMLGMSQATHWNASLISEDKVQSFIIPSLRRATGNISIGWLWPALSEFGLPREGLEMWFDPAGIKTRVDLADETEWAHDRFLVTDQDTKYALGLSQMADPTDEQLKRMLLLHMAQQSPEFIPEIMTELGIKNDMPGLTKRQAMLTDLAQQARITPAGSNPAAPAGNGKPGPQANQERSAPPNGAGRTAKLGTQRS